MMMSLRFLAAVALLVVAPSAAGAQDVDGFAARSFNGANGVTMLYRLFIPSAEARKKALPLVVYLHGSGGIGDDNLKQISGGNATGTHVWTTPNAQRRHPTYVLAPQLPQGAQWGAPGSDALSSHAEALVQLIAALTREFSLDPYRVYLTGQSLGGQGTWDMISKRPDLFAAAVPLCGDGNPSRVAAAQRLPIWVFHGAQDPLVPVTGSRDLVAALRAVGSPVKYTEYPDVGHDVWTRAYVDPALADWLFGQRRTIR
jgi:predicted peptidase